MTFDELEVGDKILFLGLHPGAMPGTIAEKKPTFAWILKGGWLHAIFYEDIVEKDTDVEIPWSTVERSDPQRNPAWYVDPHPGSSTPHHARDPARY